MKSQKQGKIQKILLSVIIIQLFLLPLATAQTIETSVSSTILNNKEDSNGLFGKIATIDNKSLTSKEEKINLLLEKDAQCIGITAPDEMISGKTTSISVTMENNGSVNWTKSAGYQLGSQNPPSNSIWVVSNVELGDLDSIAPSQQHNFSFDITAPSATGIYNCDWEMLQEHAIWFGEICLKQIQVYNCADNDSDGYYEYNELDCPHGNDCEDSYPSINPGAIETCNGIDDDCDDQIDEGNACPSMSYYCDQDQDLFISTASSGSCNTYNCTPSNCAQIQGNDCDDNNTTINPNATEVCNGVDDNCVRGADENPIGLCTDNIYCNGEEICRDGSCAQGIEPDCHYLDDECNEGVCDENTDACEAYSAPYEGQPCNYDLFCTTMGSCHIGICTGGIVSNCSDNVSCTDDSCDENNDKCVNAPNNLNCDNGLFCDGAEICDSLLGCQAGTVPNCVDSVNCTIDSCNETMDRCDNTPIDELCSDGTFCNGAEICDAQLGCQAGTVVDCSGYDLSSVQTCTNDPDNNPLTWDLRDIFISTCNEDNDSCTTKDPIVNSTCDKARCLAECETNEDCVTKCVNNIFYNGSTSICNENCSCTYQTDCDSLDGWYNTTVFPWRNTSVESCLQKEEVRQLFRNYYCLISGCNYTLNGTRYVETGNTRPKPDGSSCNDGLYCTLNDTCTVGICGGSARPVDDNESCTYDFCNETISYEYHIPIDNDGDGVSLCDNDCNDSDAAIYPGAIELCNGLDDDCDGTVDGDLTAPLCPLQYGVCAGSTQVCGGNSGWLACNAYNYGLSYEEFERTCDGLDNDCDNITDVWTDYPIPALWDPVCGEDNQTYENEYAAAASCMPIARLGECTCMDADDDSYYAYSDCTIGTDCDDSDAAINPNATEICNGVDDNCNNQTDEGVKTTYYQDNDSDTYGNPIVTIEACSAPPGYVSDNTDCDDNDTAINSAAAEICDGKDNDCNPLTTDGINEPWYLNQTTCGLGVCQSTGQWACISGQKTDTCVAGNTTGNDTNCNNIDENCDGTSDNNYIPTPTSCGLGVCTSSGSLICNSGSLNDTCTPSLPTGPDNNCNNLDENCNENVDENYIITPTSCGVGECSRTGQRICVNGTENNTCIQGTPSQEICDNLDNDCDNNTDNGGDSLCDDGLWCNGNETCAGASGCQVGIPVDCSPFNLPIIDNCTNDPDNNPLTWDYFAGFTSQCNEDADSCSEGNISVNSTCDKAQCNAECDATNACDSSCNGTVYFYDGNCQNNCTCSYQTTDCNLQDGWYDTNQTQWVDISQCTEKEQKEQENRDYTCGQGGCEYAINQTQWIDTNQTRNKQDGTYCDDDLYCTVNDQCTQGLCSGGQKDCSDSVGCTVDSCNESTDSCENNPDDSICNNNLYCDGTEICNITNGCEAGTTIDCYDSLFCTVNERCDESLDNCVSDPRDCSADDLALIETCFNDPDNNSLTWDFRNIFVSTCNESADLCTTGNISVNSTCDKSQCNAECDATNACDPTCDEDLYLYDGNCQNDCTCSYQTTDCNLQDGWYDTNQTQWIETGQCTEKEQKEQEYRDYTCGLTGCEYTTNQTRWIDTNQTRNKPSCKDMDAQCLGINAPDSIIVGRNTTISVSMKNTGINSWTYQDNYRLGCQNPQDNNIWGICRVNLFENDTVKSGDTYTFTFDITAPTAPEIYNLNWQMLQEYIAWFGEMCPNGTNEINVTYHCVDDDQDGYYAINSTECPSGNDCDDNNASINPGATELCNGKDDNCNGNSDENLTAPLCPLQYGVCVGSTQVCGGVNGWLPCDASSYGPYYEVSEITCDGLDNDCDNVTDNLTQSCGSDSCTGTSLCAAGVWSNCSTYNIDTGICAICNADGTEIYDPTQNSDCIATTCPSDGCGLGGCSQNIFADYPINIPNQCSAIYTCTSNTCTATCEPDNDNDGYSTSCGDCNDNDIAINPGATEDCSTLYDDNCDNQTNERNALNCIIFYYDNDTDNFGTSLNRCFCAGKNKYTASQSGDCNDTSIGINPNATEICNGIDDNCNNQTDEGVKITYYQDSDNDTYGNPAVPIEACSPPIGYVLNNTDCDDTNLLVHPGVNEDCSTAYDDNCNNQTNERNALNCNTFYYDNDTDSFGASQNRCYCSPHNKYSALVDNDCNDNNDLINPAQIEKCNGVDDDCNSSTVDGSGETWYNQPTSCGVGECSSTGNLICQAGAQYDTCTPGTPSDELCNGIDDNCDYQIDDGDVCPFLLYHCDQDLDSYISEASSGNCNTYNCVPSNCTQTQGNDCNDNNPLVYLGAQEIDDNLDNDCDTLIDEDFVSLNIISPINGNIYNKENLSVAITTGGHVKSIKIADNNNNYTILCDNYCLDYIGNKTFSEGRHILYAEAVDYYDRIFYDVIQFDVDLKRPRILLQYPANWSYAFGTFKVIYNESYVRDVKLYWKESNELIYNIETLVGCPSGDKVSCSKSINLVPYDGSIIDYYFTVADDFSEDISKIYTVKVDFTKPNLTVNLPKDGIYNTRSIMWDVETDEKALIDYLDNGRGPWVLCDYCDKYTKIRPFSEGNHSVLIRATDRAGNSDNKTITFLVDTIKPIIYGIEPALYYANGTFHIKYSEAHCDILTLKVNNSTHNKSKTEQCDSGYDVEKTINMDLDEFEGEVIAYTFIVEDVANNTATKSVTNLKVDTIAPSINSINYNISGSYLYLNITLGEKAKYLKYIDTMSLNPVEKTLCSSCNGYGVSIVKRIYFASGLHKIVIIAEDSAGNRAMSSSINFLI